MKPRKILANPDAIAKWKGRGRLPTGGSVDNYLKQVRDAHRD